MPEYDTKFSGTKQEFTSGATRDNATGKGKYVLIPPLPLKRLAGVYERGGKNHGERNWEQGFPISRALDSAIRHIFQYIEGMRDEDHLGQAAWNLFAAMHFEEMIERGLLPKELNDLPNYMPQEKDYLLEPEDIEIGCGSRSLTQAIDGYGYGDYKTLLGSVVGSSTPIRDGYDYDDPGTPPPIDYDAIDRYEDLMTIHFNYYGYVSPLMRGRELKQTSTKDD
jgi:hypothetical protein